MHTCSGGRTDGDGTMTCFRALHCTGHGIRGKEYYVLLVPLVVTGRTDLVVLGAMGMAVVGAGA